MQEEQRESKPSILSQRDSLSSKTEDNTNNNTPNTIIISDNVESDHVDNVEDNVEKDKVNKDKGSDTNAQLGAMLSNQGGPITVEIISVRHGDNVDVEHDGSPTEQDDYSELTHEIDDTIEEMLISNEGLDDEMSTSSGGRPKIIYKDSSFVFQQMSKNRLFKFWRCESFNRRDIRCKARIHTDLDDNVIKELGIHCCNAGGPLVRSQRAVKSRTPINIGPTRIIDKGGQKMEIKISVDGYETLVPLRPSTGTGKRKAKKVRPKPNLLPIPPEILKDLDNIPKQYKVYLIPKEDGLEGEMEEEEFLLADSEVYDEGGDQRILLFARASTAGWIDQVEQIFCDGTLGVEPILFNQVYLFMARRGAWIFPICYCLLTSKTQKSYEKMLDLIQLRWPSFSPNLASIDFEQGFANAMKIKHPQCDLHYSFFHLSQNLKKHLTEQGLIHLYNTDAVFAESARMIICLAFLPISDLAAALTVLEACLPSQLQRVFDWFLVNYTGRPRFDGTLSQPVFSPNQWNVYQRTLDGVDRIEYYVESLHRRTKRAFTSIRTNLWQFIDTIKKEQKRTDDEIVQFVSGADPPKKGRKQLAAETKILNLVQQYVPIVDHMYANQIHDPNRIIDFLAQVSRNCEADH